MSFSRLSVYEQTGTADPARVRMAGWLDAAVATIVVMVLWPIPVLRAALPWSVHGPLIVAGILLGDLVVRTVSLTLWRRTVVMYLLDLGLDSPDERVSLRKALAWSAAWTVSLVPSLFGGMNLVDPESGIPARMSGLRTRSTA